VNANGGAHLRGSVVSHVHPSRVYNSNIQASAAQNWPLKLPWRGYWHGLSVFQEKPQANPRICMQICCA
jgi:hypothetical protein